MSFQAIPVKEISCKDFKRSILSDCCKLSNECKKEGYMPAPNSNLCTGVEMPPRPKVTPRPPKKMGV